MHPTYLPEVPYQLHDRDRAAGRVSGDRPFDSGHLPWNLPTYETGRFRTRIFEVDRKAASCRPSAFLPVTRTSARRFLELQLVALLEMHSEVEVTTTRAPARCSR